MQPFHPVAAATVNIDVSGSSQSVNLGAGAEPGSIRVMNNGSATAWVAFGKSDVTVTAATGIAVGPGVTEVLSARNIDGSPLYAAVIAAGETGRIYFTPGIGI